MAKRKPISVKILLRLAKARADDATRQFNDAQKSLTEEHSRLEDAQMHAKTNHALLTEANEQIATWKRIWSTDSKHWYQKIQEQANTIEALIEGNKSLRNELDRYERFRVVSKELRA